MTPLVLALLALLLAGPLPWLLGRVPGLRRTPWAALVLWQSVALAAVLAALGAGLAVVSARALGEQSMGSYLVAATAMAVTAMVLGRLLLSGHRVGRRLRELRQRHRRQVDLLGDSRDGVVVLAHEVPTAYCVPSFARSRVVLSQGAIDALTSAELGAVLAHERAHLRARHDLVLEAFTVLCRAFPAVVTSARALDEVRLLVEVLADRTACRALGARPLVRALQELAAGATPESAMAAAHVDMGPRLDLLLDQRPRRAQAAVVLSLAAAVLVAPTLLVVLPWSERLRAGLLVIG